MPQRAGRGYHTPIAATRAACPAMSSKQSVERPVFTLTPHLPQSLGPLRQLSGRVLNSALGLNDLNAVYDAIPHGLDPANFSRCTLDQVGVDFVMDQASLANIPKTGAVIVVANHPHGALDGVGMIDLLARHRPDVRVMANHLLEAFVELKSTFIGVDPFGGKAAARFNVRAVRKALNWLRDGGLLMMFPGGEVSSFNWRQRRIVDPEWDSGIGWLVEKSDAPVVPTFIDGRNSIGFQCAGMVHERLRTMLLVREMMNHRGSVVSVKTAPPIEAETLRLLGSREAIAPYLQTNTYLIRARSHYRKPLVLGSMQGGDGVVEPLAEPVDKPLMAVEIEALPHEQRLIEKAGDLEVWVARAEQIPNVLQEIGRLRELSFRQVGEGTGKTVDLDVFDSYYLHLFVWDHVNHRIIGGYRLGEANNIIQRLGAKGLYVCSLFRLEQPLMDELDVALEVGRSFVRPEHQRNYSSLMLLWKGIARYVAAHPQYRVLFGPVSISNDYHPVSQQLMVRFLQINSMESKRASLVRPKRPFRSDQKDARRVDLNVGNLRIISSLLRTVEDDKVGVPVLLRQYLKLNGRILGFNVDADFNNAIDCLLWVDLARTDPTLLNKYMGSEGLKKFQHHHGGAGPDVQTGLAS